MTYTTSYVRCRDCGHRLIELTGEAGNRHLANDNQRCTAYECPVESLQFRQHGRAVEGGGCGAKFDLDGNRLDE